MKACSIKLHPHLVKQECILFFVLDAIVSFPCKQDNLKLDIQNIAKNVQNKKGQRMDEILGIYHTHSDMLFALEEFAKKHRTSSGVWRYLEDKSISSEDPWHKYKNNRWVIKLCNTSDTNEHAYLCTWPYSVMAMNYSEKKKQ